MPAPSSQIIPVEGFVLDQAFVDQTKSINDILTSSAAKVASLNSKALSYFNTPTIFNDARLPTDRSVNWPATTTSKLMVDQDTYSNFVSVINNDGTPIGPGLFKIIDKLIFDYSSIVTSSAIEAYLTTDTDTSAIYVPGSFSIASTTMSSVVYSAGGEPTVAIPAFATFTISVLSGITTEYYELTIYASVSAFLSGYSASTITAVIPPLPYTDLYSDGLLTTTGNVFTTATLSADLMFNTTQAVIGSVSTSGIATYNATLVDSSANQIRIPFNILYKGQNPTQAAIRVAIKDALLNSGVGTLIGWEARIPGIFITGRFYIIPLWSETYTKPGQVLYPNIQPMTDYSAIGNKILASLGHGDLTSYIDVLSVYYNRMTILAIPDTSGVLTISMLSTVVPDYQNFSATEENFTYMAALTQTFSTNLNNILAVDNTGATSQYTPSTENLLTFYTFDAGTYEFCVITKNNYTTIMESTQ